ncbi:MAG: hypothetical protein CVV50_00855 [Spirochaetae bacterium HGW-Spirochaetae-6]|nr:MAG: hypothetical protein CVV50_00855 [Spirochaetae bacterium HGW-Spirochaetae-6]
MPPRILKHLELSRIPWLKIVLRLGYPRLEALAENEEKILSALVAQTLEIWQPQAVYQTLPVTSFTPNSIETENLSIPSAQLSQEFSGSHWITLLAVTAGPKIMGEKELLFAEGQWSQAVMLDAVLSELTDELANHIQKMLLREASLKGFALTRRFSPGYGDLPLSFQKNLLDFLGADKIGLTLNEGFLLIPEKSVTAVIGWIRK